MGYDKDYCRVVASLLEILCRVPNKSRDLFGVPSKKDSSILGSLLAALSAWKLHTGYYEKL